jgi:hypothetical protein
MIAAGIIGGLLAAPFGLTDWTAIAKGTLSAADAEALLSKYSAELIGYTYLEDI